MGGYVAFAIFRHAPSYFQGLILGDTRPQADTPEGVEGRKRMLALVREKGPAAVADEMLPKLLGPETRERHPEIVDRVRALILSNSPESIAAAITALIALGVTRLALISPPWFSTEMDQHGVGYFQSQGFEVVHSGPAGLPSDQQAIEPSELYEWVRAQTPESAEAVFIGGNGLRAVGVIKTLEENLCRPILTANQVAFWQALALSGSREPVVGYGRIFGLQVAAAKSV